jgi:NAD(P)-dependent dehydrogenase (short-subunit alcohol dehydrogenase family)
VSLAGRAALVTGGGRVIGAATALALAEAGAQVSIAARNEAQVVEVATRLRERGYEAFAFRCDVIKPRDIRNLTLSAREAMGRIDILVNSAATATSNSLGRITLGEWEHIIAVNATGTFLATQSVFDEMVADRWGRIVNIAAITGLEGGRYVAAHAAAEHAVVGFTKAVAAEAVGTGVTANAVCPGYVDTPLTNETIERIMRHKERSREDALRTLLDQAGQSALIPAEDVATAIVELCADGSAERNGELVILDGKGGG